MIVNTQLKGWIQGFISVFIFLGINQVVGRYSTVILEVNPIVYSCAAFCSSSLILLALGGSGPLSKESMRSVDTWMYGFILMIGYITGMILYNYILSTELTVLQKISVGFSLLCSWFFLGRNPDKFQLLGTAIVTLAVIIVALGVPSENKGVVYLLASTYGICQALRVFVAELHRAHAKAVSISKTDPRARMRVIGFVMLVVSTLFMSLFFMIALAQENAGYVFVHNFPMLDDFMHSASILSGMAVGILLLAPLRVLEFSSSQIIKAENFMVILTFTTIATLFWEWVGEPLTGLSIKAISQQDILAIVLVTGGGLIISLSRKFSKTPKWQNYVDYAAQDLERIDDSREILANTLEHYKGDLLKVSKALDVDASALKALLEDNEKVLAFKSTVFAEVARQYRRNVAMSDALTGLPNRSAFMTALKGAAYEAKVYSVLFIDLNKFKPVNDTYGHDAGDFILQGVAKRLSKLYPRRSLVTRLGGDEFAILLLDKTKDQARAEILTIKKTLAEPFDLKGSEITIGGSVGVATYPEDGTDPEELLKKADEGMYREKDSCR